MTEPKHTGPLADFSLVISWPVQWGDQDAMGHVNNTVFFRWFESARFHYLERIGLDTLLEKENIGPILASIKCDFRRQVSYPDTVQIGTRVTRLGRSSMTIEHRLLSDAAGEVAADGDSTVVVFDYSRDQPCPIPSVIREAIEKLEGKTFSAR
jgi:acyl-CoA thioester hydrolase